MIFKILPLLICESDIYRLGLFLLFVIFRTLPESPPDSSSEPYSPQQVNGKCFFSLCLFLKRKVM